MVRRLIIMDILLQGRRVFVGATQGDEGVTNSESYIDMNFTDLTKLN